MPKYTKFTRKKYMKKHKRGRTQRGGYLFYPGPGDDVHAFEGAYTNLKDRVSSFVPSFPNLNPLSYFRTGPPIAAAPVAVDYAPAPAPAAADKPLVGNLEYQSNGDFKADSPMNVEAEAGEAGDAGDAGAGDAGAEAGAEAGDAGDGAGDAGDGAGDADDARDKQAGGRRRRRRQTTKKRKGSNKRKRTMKRRRSIRRRR